VVGHKFVINLTLCKEYFRTLHQVTTVA